MEITSSLQIRSKKNLFRIRVLPPRKHVQSAYLRTYKVLKYVGLYDIDTGVIPLPAFYYSPKQEARDEDKMKVREDDDDDDKYTEWRRKFRDGARALIYFITILCCMA